MRRQNVFVTLSPGGGIGTVLMLRIPLCKYRFRRRHIFRCLIQPLEMVVPFGVFLLETCQAAATDAQRLHQELVLRFQRANPSLVTPVLQRVDSVVGRTLFFCGLVTFNGDMIPQVLVNILLDLAMERVEKLPLLNLTVAQPFPAFLPVHDDREKVEGTMRPVLVPM